MGGALQSPGGTGAAPKGTLARSPAALEERRQDGDLVVGVPAEPAGETDNPSGSSRTLPTEISKHSLVLGALSVAYTEAGQ